MINKKISALEAKKIFKGLGLEYNKINSDSTDIEIIFLMKKFDLYLATQNGVRGIKVGGSKPSAKEIEQLKKHKPAIMAMLQKKEDIAKEKAQTEKLEKENLVKAIKNNKQKIICTLYEGEILQAHITGLAETELLESIGMAKYIGGWGTAVNSKLIEKLGTEFTWSQVLEFATPTIEAKKEKEIAEKEIATYEATRKVMRNSVCPKCGTYCYGDCEA